MIGAMLEMTPVELEAKMEKSDMFVKSAAAAEDDKSVAEEAVSALTLANDQLKAQLAQMKKKYTILLDKATSRANQPPPVSDHVKASNEINHNNTGKGQNKLHHGHATPHTQHANGGSPR